MRSHRFLLALPLQSGLRDFGGHSGHVAQSLRISEAYSDYPQIWLDDSAGAIALGSGGWIVGVLFARGGSVPLRALPDHAPVHDNPQRLAEWLVRECWGAYLAILPDPQSGAVMVMPDPSGLLPVYRLATSSHLILTSDLTLLDVAGVAVPSVSWPDLNCHLRWPELRQRATCLSGVSELSPGELLPLGSSALPGRAIWRPDAFMPVRGKVTFDDAAEELRDLAISVIGAWASYLGPVAVAASGGVDSSLICAALAKGGHSFGCITLSTSDPSGDERRFVWRLGEHLGVRVENSIYDASLIDLERAASVGLARPQRKTFMQALDHALGLAGGELGAEVIFDGNGGDNLFCFLHSSAPVVDSLRRRGPGVATLKTFLDMCRLTGCDVGTMARAVIQHMARPGRTAHWAPDRRLLADCRQAGSQIEPLTPWFAVQVSRLAGKRDHLELIMRCQNHLHSLVSPASPSRFSPLMSQPLVEFCLSMPTWLWCTGGMNRALARAAFAGDLPHDIVVRTSKSGPDSFIRRLFADRRAQIRDMLLGGMLAENGLIDLEAVELALSASAETGDSIIYRLLDLTEAEAWTRSWSQ